MLFLKCVVIGTNFASTDKNIKGMELLRISSYQELHEKLKGSKRAYLLLYKEGSPQSECALKNLESAQIPADKVVLMKAQVGEVRDIHPVYNISSVPALLEFSNGELKNVVKGCNPPDYYKAYIENSLFSASTVDSDTPQKRVTIYTTPTCTWCNALKTHLRKFGIRYTEVDVASDPHAAEEMVSKSGQRGVPQADIEGEIIVGFDKVRINKLLGING